MQSNVERIKHLSKLFNEIAYYHRRDKVFNDFVSLAAIAIHNNHAMFCQDLEQRYLSIIDQYEREDVNKLCQLMGEFICELMKNPHDLLGQLYMSLEIGDRHLGQFFSPPSIQQILSTLLSSDIANQLKDKTFISVQEPSAGASGHVIELAERVRECGYDPADKLFASCIDIDICAVFMSYLQLSLLGIPAVIQHGNTLTLEVWRTLKTPAFYTHKWNEKLAEKNTFQDSFPPLLSQMPLAI